MTEQQNIAYEQSWELNTGIKVMQFRNQIAAVSDKLRISFGITSDKKITNPFYAFQLLVTCPDITAEQIGSILCVSSRSAEILIKQSREENLIERIGGKKEGCWKIINPKN